MINERSHAARPGNPGDGPVVYWMSREQRARDNWALLYAADKARERGVPLAVVFCLVPGFLGAPRRHYAFMLEGLACVAADLAAKRMPFFLLEEHPRRGVPRFLEEHHAGLLVTDFDPLRIKQEWARSVADAVHVPVMEVDAHNIVPCRAASNKREYGAYTLRPKLRRALPRFLEPFPRLGTAPVAWPTPVPDIDWAAARQRLRADASVGEVTWLQPGERAAKRMLRTFLDERLAAYDQSSRDPTQHGLSDLSPYLHYGQISAQRVALEVMASPVPPPAREAFMEELIVRRELSDNFCLHTPDYDSVAAFPEWARKTLAEHAADPREYVYAYDRLEAACTHDELWNAAQTEMVVRGKMHGYLRMYWAKKILEWTPDAETALATVLALNDRYELDGRDPNGYAGAAWSIGGVHDRAWSERPVFGKIRYMSYGGCKSKFNVKAYIQWVARLTA